LSVAVTVHRRCKARSPCRLVGTVLRHPQKPALSLWSVWCACQLDLAMVVPSSISVPNTAWVW
jgi:hypothetical protein